MAADRLRVLTRVLRSSETVETDVVLACERALEDPGRVHGLEVVEGPEPLRTGFVMHVAPELPIAPFQSLRGKTLFITGASRGYVALTVAWRSIACVRHGGLDI